MPDDTHSKPTPEYGTPIPDDPITLVDVSDEAAMCPHCRGEGGFLTTYWEGAVHRGIHARCPVCNGHRTVSREVHAEWHAKRKAGRR
jgi:RNA polymerase subunit RPABC4/transcription elongation factor Spt4